jgi:2,3-dihydroxybenzoate-AMP ligase
MMDGVISFPGEFAARYRARGYWEDRPMRDVFRDWCRDYAGRVALHGAGRSITYRELDRQSTNLALNLLELGLRPRDSVVVQLPNVIEFVLVHFALQKIGAMPVLALPPHRFREIHCFAEIAQATAIFTPDRQRDFSYVDMVSRVRAEVPSLRHAIVLGDAPAGFASLLDLIERPATRPESTWRRSPSIRIRRPCSCSPAAPPASRS